MMLGVLMRVGTLLIRALRSTHHASGDAEEDAVPAEDAANGEGAVGKGGGGGKGSATAATVGGDLSKARTPPSLLLLLCFSLLFLA
jgi:hypothetical protein